jgi:Icc-related predicted phosphoesterase
MAFSCPRDQLYKKWNLIPSNIDILMTHMPPKQILDKTYLGKHWGCSFLKEKVLGEIKPKVHVFGHVHEGTW